ncbi:MAG: arsenate reductase ArsC [Candidatus Margulisiibacteriota bacterium]
MSKRKKILFACVANAARSQIAEGWAKKLAGDKIEVFSCGSKPIGRVGTYAIAVMKEVGIDISDHTSKGFSDLPKIEFDYVVTMGCGEACPSFISAKQRLDWQIEDPKGQDMEFYRKTRAQIEAKVKELLRGV